MHLPRYPLPPNTASPSSFLYRLPYATPPALRYTACQMPHHCHPLSTACPALRCPPCATAPTCLPLRRPPGYVAARPMPPCHCPSFIASPALRRPHCATPPRTRPCLPYATPLPVRCRIAVVRPMLPRPARPSTVIHRPPYATPLLVQCRCALPV